jgi:anti-sigma factor RsiW
MACEPWIEKLDAYFDGELSPGEARAVAEHLQGCSSCTAEGLRKVQVKRAVHSAGLKFTADPAFRIRIQNSVAERGTSTWRHRWFLGLATATALLIISGFLLTLNRDRGAQQELLGELADLHVATLASANPVDVVSTDRHTVKPWFQGKIPFTFNLPELQNSPFTLVGGRVSYLNQSPGAELIFRVRQHQISVFVFQDRGLTKLRGDNAATTAGSFGARSWNQGGLRYFVIGDASPQDLDKLSELLKAAG